MLIPHRVIVRRAGRFHRPLKFVVVGGLGLPLQLGSLWLLHRAGWSIAAATFVAVELAVVHAFLWHDRWTWGGRRPHDSIARKTGRFLRFQAANGLVSSLGNILLTPLLAAGLRLPVLVANLTAVGLLAILNYVAADRLVFAVRGRSQPTGVPFRGGLAVAIVSSALLPAPVTADTPSASVRSGWLRYISEVERALAGRETAANGFLDVDRQPPSAAAHDWAELSAGRVVMENLAERPHTFALPSLDNAEIHHWRGTVFVAGTTLDKVLAVARDPAAHRQEDILEARLIERRGDWQRVGLRLVRHLIVTAVFDTEHEVEFHRWSDRRATSRSVATHIAEVADLGKPTEHEKPPDEDRGFLWRLNAYWRYEARPGGVTIEVESVSLSRDVPMLIGPIVRPLVNRVARESLERTLLALHARLSR